MISKRPKSYRIPYAKPVFGEEEKQAVIKTMEKGWLGIGEKTEEFEYEFAKWHGRKYGVMVNSGSMANVLATETLVHIYPEIKEFVSTPYSFPTTINHAIKLNLKPIFIDVNYTLNVTHNALNANIGNNEFVILAHTMGNAFPVGVLDKRPLLTNRLIEDCADALGTTINNRKVGTFGLMSTFSFFASHMITAFGEGGMILTDSEECYKHLMSLRSWGRSEEFYTRNPKLEEFKSISDYFERFVFTTSGYNCKTIEVQAAFALEQMKRLEGFISKRKGNYRRFKLALEKYFEYFRFVEVEKEVNPSWFGFPMIVKTDKFTRNEICKFLEDHNIEIRMLFGGNLLRHPYTEDWPVDCKRFNPDKESPYEENKFPVCDDIMNNGFFIGVGPHHIQT